MGNSRLVFLLLVFSAALAAVYGTPASPTDVFTSPCPFLTDPSPAISPISPASPPPPSPPPPSPPLFPPPPNAGSCSWVCSAPPPQANSSSSSSAPGAPATVPPPDTTGFELWSSPATWPSGIVPGLPGISDWANATVPCGRLVLLDVPAVNLAVLQIKGFLKVLDHPSLPSISVRAHFIVVEGQLLAGAPSQQFRQKLTVELTPNRNNRANFAFTSFAPAEPLYPRNLGHKAFAVVGGQVRLHGLPGPPSMPVWVKLQRSAQAGDTSISVDANVADSWPVGSCIVIASTDYDRKQAEVFNVTGVIRNGTGAVISLSSPLQYMHYGQPNSLPNGMGGFVDQRAEVALLSRNIVITGTDEPEPYQYDGGHFIVFMTSTPQYIEGVEFLRLGQQGTLGRYSIHFHVVGSVPGTVCRKNTIHHSKQRCIVVHASHNITLDSNVAYNTSGHCFMTEEGGEVGNTFIRNIGILTNKVDRKIMLSGTNPPISEETDDEPSTFWITNPRNNIINNVAAGSETNGIWIELRSAVRGMSLNIPGINTTTPVSQSLADFSGNVAHSNGDVRIRFYPHGLRPRDSDWNPVPGNVDRLTLYKNVNMGLFIHATDYLTVSDSDFADNGWGVFLNQDQTVTLKDSRMVALTENYGNPEQCWRTDTWAPCRPVSGCIMPLQWGVQGRSTGGVSRNAPTFGVLIDKNRLIDNFLLPNVVQNISFTNYDRSCRTASAIALVGGADFWNPGHSVKSLSFSSNTNPIWFPPRIYQYNLWNTMSDGGEQSQFHTLWDRDGSIMGSPGYLVANNLKILPPGAQNCQFNSIWNAYSCPGTCYRSIQISYPEPGFTSTSKNVNFTRGDFSYVQIIRVSDGQVISLDGNLNKVDEMLPVLRNFFAVLLAGQTYQVTVVPSSSAPTFTPANILVRYRGQSLCGVGLTLQIQPQPTQSWTLPNSDSVFFRQCVGATPLANTTSNMQYSYVCSSSNQPPWLELALGPVWRGTTTLVPGNNSIACSGNTQCGIVWSGSNWRFDDSGKELRPFFYNPLTASSTWKNGTGPLGFTGWRDPSLSTFIAQPSASILTYYFRRTFTLTDTACYSSLQIEVIVDDGVILYLNNQEMLRSNLPNGTLSNKTTALAQSPWMNWQTFLLPLSGDNPSYYLVEGVNTIAAEVHAVGSWAWQLAFDIRVSGIRRPSCSGPSITPEICDGVDNNNNGNIDESSTGQLLTRSCQTACGVGIETCTSGIFQQCTAPPVNPEVCNGVDDDCDGLVDNGGGQLDCTAGWVCSRGRCLPVGNATTPTEVWPRNATAWAFYDKGGNMDALNPTWKTGNVASWPTGKGPLGFNLDSPAWDTFGSTLRAWTQDGNVTAYFAKAFSLTASQINSTYGIDFNIRRVDGAVVYLNGIEIWRPQMPLGLINSKTTPTSSTSASGSSNLAWSYNKCETCFRNTSSPLVVGTNWIAVELHAGWAWKRSAAVDMDLFRNVVVPCSALPGSPTTCVRQVDQTIILANTNWQYIDGSQPLPTGNWMFPTYDSSSWPSGPAPLGWTGYWLLKTVLVPGPTGSEPRRTFYFRKTIQVPDAACNFQLTSQLLSNDGAVLYINGVEAYRTRSIPAGPVNATSFASYGGDWAYRTIQLSGGWFKTGSNLLAVELHRAQSTNQWVFFDWQIIGSREALTCSPLPL